MNRTGLIADWNKKCRGFTSCDMDPNYTSLKLKEKKTAKAVFNKVNFIDNDPNFENCHNNEVKIFIQYSCDFVDIIKMR
jgi:hypothetical protein